MLQDEYQLRTFMFFTKRKTPQCALVANSKTNKISCNSNCLRFIANVRNKERNIFIEIG